MYIKDSTVFFEPYDMNFVKKFGIVKASEIAVDFKLHSNLPPIFDTYLLAGFLGVGRKSLFGLVKNSSTNYKLITVKKKNGNDRTIYAPNETLKQCQKKILRHILNNHPVSDHAKAYRKGSTLKDNAYPHTGKKYILKLDITDFFGSIHFNQVYSSAFNKSYFPKQIGVMLTSLCCRNGGLPQGAPSSPVLSNVVMRNFDENISKWCQTHDITYTRYCDDMTFSSDNPLYTAYRRTKSMLENMGFKLNEAKTKFVTNANRQSVTGLTVNEKVSVSKDYKHQLRQEVYYALKFGLAESIFYAGKAEFVKNLKPDTERYYNHLVGRLNFLLQIEPDNSWFRKSLETITSNEWLYQEI